MSLVSAQDNTQLINDINNKLSKNEVTISEILSDSSLMFLHSLTPFREMIKQNAKAEKIKIIPEKEPGTRITVKGVIINAGGQPSRNVLVYVYQTSSEGWYSDTAPHILQNEGDRKHARLFGYFKTNAAGEFEFETVKPQGYPHSDLPAHIHFEVSSGKNSLITELLFDDDPRLVGNIRTRAMQENFIISKNTGTEMQPVYFINLH
jgi:protocatechuate 3,4-dioxygenase beta subunit